MQHSFNEACLYLCSSIKLHFTEFIRYIFKTNSEKSMGSVLKHFSRRETPYITCGISGMSICDLTKKLAKAKCMSVGTWSETLYFQFYCIQLPTRYALSVAREEQFAGTVYHCRHRNKCRQIWSKDRTRFYHIVSKKILRSMEITLRALMVTGFSSFPYRPPLCKSENIFKGKGGILSA